MTKKVLYKYILFDYKKIYTNNSKLPNIWESLIHNLNLSKKTLTLFINIIIYIYNNKYLLIEFIIYTFLGSKSYNNFLYNIRLRAS